MGSRHGVYALRVYLLSCYIQAPTGTSKWCVIRLSRMQVCPADVSSGSAQKIVTVLLVSGVWVLFY